MLGKKFEGQIETRRTCAFGVNDVQKSARHARHRPTVFICFENGHMRNAEAQPRNAAQPARLRLAAAPVFWKRIQGASVRRARVALQEASEEELADCIASPMAGVLASIIRAAGARVPEVSRSGTISKPHADIEAELLEVVQLGLRRGLSPDQPTPWADAEIFTPPMVAAASYDFERLLDLLLAEGADTMQRNSDGEVALHAAVDRPSALRRLLAVPQPLLQTSLAAISGNGRTPFIAALLRNPLKPIHIQACDAMVAAGSVALTDHDFACIQSAKRLPRLLSAVDRCYPAVVHPRARWHPTWHWSFPASDRHTIRITFELARRGHASLPPELWLTIFGQVQRGWFACSARVSPPPHIGGAARAELALARDVLRQRLQQEAGQRR